MDPRVKNIWSTPTSLVLTSKQYIAMEKKKGKPETENSFRYFALAKCRCSKSNQKTTAKASKLEICKRGRLRNKLDCSGLEKPRCHLLFMHAFSAVWCTLKVRMLVDQNKMSALKTQTKQSHTFQIEKLGGTPNI